MSLAAEKVRAEVSGLPPGKWERRLFMVLQAAVDDSGNAPDQHTFVLAGFLASAEQWIAFSRDWQAALDEAPALPYFKFKEADGLKDAFDPRSGWTPELRDARIARLTEIVCAHVQARFHVAMRHDHFQAYIRSIPVPGRRLLSDHPYLLSFGRVLQAVGLLMWELDLRDPCDFYFDSQDGFDVEVTRMWPESAAVFGTTPPELLAGKPPPKLGNVTFRREQDFLPLQAADLLAGIIRGASMSGTAPSVVKPLESIKSRAINLDEAEVRRVGDQMRKFVAFYHPEADLVTYDPTKAKRQRKLARKGPKPSRR